MGVAAGAGVYLPLVAATAATLVVLVGVNLVKTSLLGRFGVVHRLTRIEYRRGHGTIGPVIRQLEQLRCRIRQLQVEDDDEDCQEAFGVRRVTICVQTHDQDRLATAVNALERREEILTIAVEPLAG